MLVCAELQYTNSQIWFIRFDVDQSSKLVCVGNQAGEIFVWMLSGTEFVQVLLLLLRDSCHRAAHSRSSQVSSCSCKKHPACVRQTALAATGFCLFVMLIILMDDVYMVALFAGHIIVATDDGALMLFSPAGSGVDAGAADEEE